MGFELVGLILGCFFLGQMLDEKYQTRGLIFVGLTMLALVGWLVRIIWLLRRMQRQDEAAEEAKRR
jgi:uncharacterized membrane protein